MKIATVFSDTKKHYEILDGLRGIAAILVVMFHIFETFSGGNPQKQIINHGYLAVDFFFILSGFVIGYAYDDRWKKMTLKNFFKRRLIRLHPMIIMGMLIGGIGYYLASPVGFPLINETPVWKLLLIMLIGFTLLPLPVSMDIRGWREMHPLNGPAWSLLFEYIANILYAFFIRKLPNKILAILVFFFGCMLIHLAVTSPNGNVAGGWSLTSTQLHVAFTRLLYPFTAGLLLSRIRKPTKIKNAFWWCALLLIVILAFPRVGNMERVWINGLYESFSIIILFPLIIYMGASGNIEGKISSKICKFLGNISYPLYITHYPLVYIFTGWKIENNVSLEKAWPTAILIIITAIIIAYACLKLYDIPIRKYLVKKFMNKKT